jgi:hypothetical protein
MNSPAPYQIANCWQDHKDVEMCIQVRLSQWKVNNTMNLLIRDAFGIFNEIILRQINPSKGSLSAIYLLFNVNSPTLFQVLNL